MPLAVEKERIDSLFHELFGNDANLEDWRRDLATALEEPRKTGNVAPERPRPKEPSSVPLPTAYFVGRSEAVEALTDAICTAGAAAVLLHGSPGIGKTELAKAVAHHPASVQRFGSRRWFARLETSRTASAALAAVCGALDVEPKGGLDAVLERLRAESALLVLDNLETPWGSPDERETLERMLAALASEPGATILATIRGTEFVGGPRWKNHLVDEISLPVAASLFSSIAGDWVRSDALVGNVVEALGGVPLAVELVARRAYGRSSLAPLWDQWLKVGTDFAERPGVAAGRETSLNHSIELSLFLIAEPAAMRVLALLASLPAGVNANDLDELFDDAFAAIERLLGAGLAFEREGRINLLPPIREYVRRRHPVHADDATRIALRYFDYVERFENVSGIRAKGALRRRLETELPNILFSTDILMTNLRLEYTPVYLRGLFDILIHASNLLDATHIFARLRSVATENCFPLGQAACAEMQGRIDCQIRRPEEKFLALEEAVAMYQKLGHVTGEASCLAYMADWQTEVRDDLYYRAARLFADAGDAHSEAGVWKAFAIAVTDNSFDRYPDSYAFCERAHRLYDQLGDKFGLAHCLLRFGQYHHLYLRDYRAAEDFYLQSLSLKDEDGFPLQPLAEVFLRHCRSEAAEAVAPRRHDEDTD